MSVTIHEAENLEFLRAQPDEAFDLAYLDPPFNTGRTRRHQPVRVERDEEGERVGFGDHRYRAISDGPMRAYADAFDDYLGFLGPRLEELRRVLTSTGSLLLHLDPRESHYAKVFLDHLFGRASFQNEIVWAYDFGARSRSRWSSKHDVILWYTKDPKRFTYRYDDIDRVPYMAPGLVGPEKARRGKTPTDVWWQTIVPPGGKERTGYPTQKPLAVLSRIVRVHADPGARVLDVFAGSGTTGEAAAREGREAVLVDHNPEAIDVMRERLAPWEPRVVRPAGAPDPTV